jgi:hypothetical protein
MDQIVDPIKSPAGGFDLGTWLGRNQAFALMVGRCSTGFAECLLEIKENRRYLALEDTWEDFCANRLAISRATADRIIRQYRQLGATFSKLSSFVRIKPSEYNLIAAAVTHDGLSFNGEVIPLEAQNTTRLAEAVGILCHQAVPQPSAPQPSAEDLAGHAFAKAEKSLQTAFTELERLRAMNLDPDGRLRLLIAVEGGLANLTRIREATTPTLDLE